MNDEDRYWQNKVMYEEMEEKFKMHKQKQLAVVNEMGEYTHTIWKVAYVNEKLKEAFGIEVEGGKYGKEYSHNNEPFVGIDSEGVLRAIAKKFNHVFSDKTVSYEGRGFRVSAMAGELRQLLDKTGSSEV